jgi:hypothetical protein
LLLAGFVMVAPRGTTPGGAAHGNVPLGVGGGLVTTPGSQREQEDTGRRRKMIRVLVGIALLGAGLVVIFVAG